MEYYIYISNECNLGCSYCSVLFDTKKYNVPMLPTYSFADLKHFVDRTQKQYNESIADIYFFGGEPTMRYDLIKELIDLFENTHDYSVNYIMHTNGIRIPLAPQKIISKLKVTLLSINYEEIFDNNKIILPYYDIMIKSINYLRSNKRNYIIGRFTISEK